MLGGETNRFKMGKDDEDEDWEEADEESQMSLIELKKVCSLESSEVEVLIEKPIKKTRGPSTRDRANFR